MTKPSTHASSPPILYNIAFDGPKSVLIDWGNAPGWLKEHADVIGQAGRVSLIPKTGMDSVLPGVSVVLQEDQEYIVYSRVFGHVLSASESPQVRLYCIGWRARNGSPAESKTWVYPNGFVEQAPEPTMVGLFFHYKMERDGTWQRS